MVTDKERYLFDLNGYIVIKNALNTSELDRVLGSVAEAGGDSPERLIGNTKLFRPLLEQDEIFRSIIDHPRILPYLLEWVGARGWTDLLNKGGNERSPIRLDNSYFIFQRSGDAGGDMHLGGTPYSPPCSYHVHNGDICSALTVVSYVLTAAPEGAGGFACIPGSHKSNFPCPPDMEKGDDRSCFVSPVVEPGDAIIFTEALTHGTLPWTARHMRQVMFYKYAPAHMAFYQSHWSPRLIEKCSPRQRSMLISPGVADVPAFFE